MWEVTWTFGLDDLRSGEPAYARDTVYLPTLVVESGGSPEVLVLRNATLLWRCIQRGSSGVVAYPRVNNHAGGRELLLL